MPDQDAGLPVPRTADGQAGLAALLAEPGRSLIGLDFDGTLAPIVDDPAAARAAPGTVAVLRRVALLAGTLAVITGRPAAEAVDFAGLTDVPGVIVLGHYGRQRWERGVLTSPAAPPGLHQARAELSAVLAQAGVARGVWVEDKGDALAVHTRRAGQPQAELDRLSGPMAALAHRTGLEMQPGRLVIELRPPGGDKGQALRQLAAQRAPSAILFCGDDLGDRPAFQAVRDLRASGTPGLVVCSGSAEVPELAAETDLVVDGPDGVVRFLTELISAWSAT